MNEWLPVIFGCLGQLIVLILACVLGDFLMGYCLETWVGYTEWGEVNFLLRWIIGLIAIEVTLPVAIIGFIVGLVAGVPIFPV